MNSNTQPRKLHSMWKTGAPDFFWIKYLNTRANLCEGFFYPSSIKNDIGAVAMRNISVGQ